MKNKSNNIEEELKSLEKKLQDRDIYNNPQLLKEISSQYNKLKKQDSLFKQLEDINKKIFETKKNLIKEDDKQMIELIDDELKKLNEEKLSLEKEVKKELTGENDEEKNDIIMEIRAGTGGEEAALFASDLFKMYSRYAEKKGWKTNLVSSHYTSLGGLKEVIFEIKGPGAYVSLKNESGVHRVQRIPSTEKSGRLHTSAATVVILPKALPMDIKLDPQDIRVEAFRASGHGGQYLQKTSSAIRVTHIPTGVVVSCQNERSQQQNKERALMVLRSRLFARKKEKEAANRDKERKTKIGHGDRSEKIRTYNFPQDRVTDHRIKKTWHNIEQIMDGNIDSIVNEMKTYNN